MQNSDKTDKLFLLPNAAARLKRKDGRFDLTSAGLMSLIAACGGSDGGIPDPTVLDDIAQADLLTAAPVVYTNSLVGLSYTNEGGNSVVSGGNNIIVTRDDNGKTVTLKSGENTFIMIAEDEIAGSGTDPNTYSSNTVAFAYGNLGGGDAVDLAVGSASSDGGKGSFAIIWDYAPAGAKFKGKTFNLTGDNYAGDMSPNNNNIPHLRFNTSSRDGAVGFSANEQTNYFRAHALDDEPAALFVSNEPRNLFAVVWDIEQYQRGQYEGKSHALDVKHKPNTMLIISSTSIDNFYFQHTQFLNLGDDDKADLLLPTYSDQKFKMMNIIWNIVSHKSDADELELGGSNSLADTYNDNVFSIISSNNEPQDNGFPLSSFSRIDLDGDGSYDLHTNHKDGIIFWGAEFKDEGDLRTDSIFIHNAEGDVAFTGSSANSADGMWLNGSGATLAQLVANFYFVDVDQDGLRDAIYKTATDGNYSWWKLTGEKNVIADSADLSKGFGDASKGATAQTEANLKALGVIGYYRKDFNEDGKPDFIAETANPALDDGKVYHNVWYAKSNGSLDSTARHDALVQVTAAGNLADGADMFQLVDIA